MHLTHTYVNHTFWLYTRVIISIYIGILYLRPCMGILKCLFQVHVIPVDIKHFFDDFFHLLWYRTRLTIDQWKNTRVKISFQWLSIEFQSDDFISSFIYTIHKYQQQHFLYRVRDDLFFSFFFFIRETSSL